MAKAAVASRSGTRSVPVLMYHRLGTPAMLPPADLKYCVSTESFRRQLRHLGATGCRIALLSELWRAGNPPDAAERPVVVTFDDGRQSDYEAAYPLLRVAGARAEFFLNTATIGQPGFLAWNQIAEMQRAGMSFQSHGRDHVVLHGLPRAALKRQLLASKLVLEDRLGQPVQFLAVPYGILGRAVVDMAAEVGYRAVCNSRCWPARAGASVVNRIPVRPDTTMCRYAGLVERRRWSYVPELTRAVLGHVPKRILLKLRPSALGVELLTEGA